MQEFGIEIGSRNLTVKINDWAMQASASVLAQYGGTVVLATVTQAEQARAGIDYFPLMVDYEERFYAGGKIGGSRFVRREGRPSDDAILAARMIDRALRPLFDNAQRKDVQIVITVLSFDKENDPDIIALIAASLALTISPIFFTGPIAAIRLGLIEGSFVVNPTYKERSASSLDLVLAGHGSFFTMIEAGANEVSEDECKKAFREGVAIIEKLVEFQKTVAEKFAKQKYPVIKQEQSSALRQFVQSFVSKRLQEALFKTSDIELKKSLSEIRSELLEKVYAEFNSDMFPQATMFFYEEVGISLKENVLRNDIRPDGRKPNELRAISCEVGILPCAHGSALFMRGMTHALSVVTLGAPGDERLIDTMEIEEKQRYMHHYNFPPFSVGEVRPFRGPSRRDLGHGYLAQRALQPVLPSLEEFPYTIRVVTEILSSNGSSSMASACGSSLALMDAGVPIKAAVAGIAMGLLYKSEDDFKILTDIQGPEDQEGEMDFKIAGTLKGITAMQMDMKLRGIPFSVLDKTLDQAKSARIKILETMNKEIAQARASISPIAPRVFRITIDPAKIRFVIGPGGEVINGIIAKTGAKIDIENDGTVFITSPDEASGLKAKEIVEQITHEYKEGDTIKGRVSSITDFGAFVEITPGKEGLIHVSELADKYVEKVSDVVSLGDIVEARVIGVDREGKIRLSLKKANHLPHTSSPFSQDKRRPPSQYGQRTTHQQRYNKNESR